MIKVAIIGAGVLGQHIAHYLNQSDVFDLIGFYDDIQKPGTKVEGISVLGPISDIDSDFKAHTFKQLVIGIGYNHMLVRQEIYEKFQANISFATYIHPSVYIDRSVAIGQGVVVLPGCVFDKDVVIGNNVFFNIGCLVAHDTIIGDNSFFAPGVKLAGFIHVGERCFLGIDTSIIDNVHLCPDIQTGGGTVVTTNIVQPGLYAGTPAKLLKEFKEI